MRRFIVDDNGITIIETRRGTNKSRNRIELEQKKKALDEKYSNSAQGEYILDYLKSVLGCK